MKLQTVGKLMIVIGVALVLYALSMPVAFDHAKVVNIHLMNERQNMLFIGGVLFIAGIVLFATNKNQHSEAEVDKETPRTTDQGNKGVVEQSDDTYPETFFEKSLRLIGVFLKRIGLEKIVEIERFLNDRRIIVAMAVGGLFVFYTYSSVRNIEYVTLSGWISLLDLLLAALFIYLGGNGKKELLLEQVQKQQMLEVGRTPANIGESVCQLLLLIIAFWFYEIEMLDIQLNGEYVALLPLAVLFVIGLHLKTRKISEWSKVSLIVPLVGITLILYNLWREANLTLQESTNLLLENISSFNFSFLVPGGVDFALLIIFLSVLVPQINGSKLFGYKYGSLKYDINLKLKTDKIVVLPLYSAFVYGVILHGMYSILDFVLRLIKLGVMSL